MSGFFHVATYVLAAFGLLVVVLIIVEGCRSRASKSTTPATTPTEAAREPERAPLQITNLRVIGRQERSAPDTREIAGGSRDSSASW